MTGSIAHPENLPWFASGALAGPEAAAIERHLRGCGACRDEVAALRSMTRSLRASAGSHVAADRLVAYHEGSARLAPDEGRRIQDHLARCPSCSADLDALRRAEGAPHRRSARPVLAAAASVLLVLAAAWRLGGHGVEPAVDTSPVRLELPPGQRGMGDPPSVPGGRPLAIEAWLPLLADAPAYRVRLRRADATAKLELDETVRRAPEQQKVRLSLPHGLRPGHHLLSFSETGDRGREIDVRGFDVEGPP